MFGVLTHEFPAQLIIPACCWSVTITRMFGRFLGVSSVSDAGTRDVNDTDTIEAAHISRKRLRDIYDTPFFFILLHAPPVR
jgi:hypothetical protein